LIFLYLLSTIYSTVMSGWNLTVLDSKRMYRVLLLFSAGIAMDVLP